MSDTHIDGAAICEKYPQSLSYYVHHFAGRFSQPRKHLDNTAK